MFSKTLYFFQTCFGLVGFYIFLVLCFCSLTQESQQQPPPATVTHQSPFTQNYHHPRSNSIIPHHSPFQYHLQHSASSPLYPPQPGFRPMYLQQWQQNVPYGPSVSSPPRGFKLPMPLPGQSQSPAPAPPVSKVSTEIVMLRQNVNFRNLVTL